MPLYEFTLNLSCPPGQVDKFIQLAHAVTDSLQQHIPASYIERYVAQAKSLQQQQREDASFWNGYLLRTFFREDDPYDLAHYPYYYRKLTPATMQQTAKLLWANKPYIQAVQLPQQ
jgi:hypothetical protein